MSRRRDTRRSTEPEYYSEILQHRDTRLNGQLKVRKVDLKFVPTGEEVNAVYHTPLTELLSKRQLPFFVRLKEELALDERRDTKVVRRGRTLTLHFIIRPKKVFVTDNDGKEIVLPLYARQLYDVLPREPHHDDKVFQGTAEVIQSKPLPKRLRILAAVSSGHPDESQEAGEVIDVSHIERRGQLRVLVGKSTITRKQFAFSEKMSTSSYTTMTSKQPLHLSEIMKKYDLPLRVRKTEDKSCCFTLQECKAEAQVIATVPGLAEAVYAIPLTSTVMVEYIADQSPILADSVSQLYPLVNWTLGLFEVDRTRLSPTLTGIPQPLLDVLCEWMNSKEGYELAARISEGSVKSKNDTIAEQTRRIKSLEKQLETVGTAPPTPLLPDKKKAPAVSRKPATSQRRAASLSDDTYNSVQYPPVPAPRRNSHTPSHDQTDLKELRTKITELQKERKQHLLKISTLEEEVARLNKQIKSNHVYVKPEPVTSSLKEGTVADVLKFLCGIGLSEVTENFEKERVDGALLYDLDVEILNKELGVSKLNAKRILIEIQKEGRR